MKKLLPLLTLAVLLLGACQDGDLPTAVTPIHPPLFNISDGMNSGNLHFFFLPPMVGYPTYSGSFDGSLSPVVEICQWTTSGCATPLVAQYTTTAGPGSETVRVDATSEQYVVNWHTDQFSLNLDHTYRIRVLVAGTPLGYADMKLYSSGKAANTTTSTEIALVDGKTLPIKFRIEQGAVYVLSGTSGGTISSVDGSVALEFPPGVVNGEIGVTIEPTLLSLAEQVQMVAGAAFEFQPSPMTFTEPVTLSIGYDPTRLPAGTDVSELRLFKATHLADGTLSWRVVPGSAVVAGTNTVSGQITSFSHYGVGTVHQILSYVLHGLSAYCHGAIGVFYLTNEDATGHAMLSATAPRGVAPDWSRVCARGFDPPEER